MSILYRPSPWVWCDKAKKMVKRNPGKPARTSLMGKAPIKSQLTKFGV